ncbi:PucR family transcriptional regulator [Bacillus sp. FSL K6-3431]|uniref:PucR family transcriptional regulator n=1 Tax=Bacillus sp. FSL K6-3431 TaxID=2921500 RepID=UPI0030F5845B
MIKQLLYLYPNSILSKEPTTDPRFLWYKDVQADQCIGIPKTDLTHKEVKLLETLYPLDNLENPSFISHSVQEWRNFLHFDGPMPALLEENCRFIHFYISNMKEAFQFEEWEEALKGLFPQEITIIPFNNSEGVIIEKQTELHMDEDELISAVEAFESDFFFKVHFHIGRFHSPNIKLKQQFNLEQTLFKLSLTKQPEDRISTLEKLMPHFVYESLAQDTRQTLFSDIHHIFSNDHDFLETIKQYIENQSNATLTAKQLFMHRNSLQYRIDKFIEKTGIDIKSFHGAFLAYLACLHIGNE